MYDRDRYAADMQFWYLPARPGVARVRDRHLTI